METKNAEQLLTVDIPLYNEAENLPAFARTAMEFCRARNWPVIFVNDGSLDATKQILDGLETEPHVKVVHHKVNRGYGGALKTGIRQVNTPYLVTIDGDDQHHLEDVEKLFQFAVQKDGNMVVGKREGANVSTTYRALGKFLIRSFTKNLGAPACHRSQFRFQALPHRTCKTLHHRLPRLNGIQRRDHTGLPQRAQPRARTSDLHLAA